MSFTMSPLVSSCLLLHLLFPSSLGSVREVSGNNNSSRNTISHKEESIDDVRNYKDEGAKFSFLPESTTFAALCDDAGYKTLRDGERMFYFFVKAVDDPKSKPIIIWLNGGPGDSSLIGFFYENGPFKINDHEPALIWNVYGWDKIANILYIDQPIGTGLSYASASTKLSVDRFDVIADLNQFLQEFMKSHHEYAKKGFYIAGQSYGARFAVSLAYRILLDPDGRIENERDDDRKIEINGIILGNPLIDLGTQYESIPYYVRSNNNLQISTEDLDRIFKLIPLCIESIKRCVRIGDDHLCRQTYETCNNILEETKTAIKPPKNVFDITSDSVNYDYTLMEEFLNHPNARGLLNLPNEESFSWHSPRVFDELKGDWASSSKKALGELLRAKIKVLIYVGDNDIVCNYLGVLKTILNLKWYGNVDFGDSLVHDFFVDHKEAGKYRNFGPLTYIKVYNAGDKVPMDQSKVAWKMIGDWILLVTS